MDRSMVIALNMYDEVRARGGSLDYDSLGAMIGVPMIPIVAKTGEGIKALFDKVVAVFEGHDDTVRHIHVNLGHKAARGYDKGISGNEQAVLASLSCH